MTEPEVTLDGVELRAGAKTLLGPLSLSVSTGEHVLVVGRSGTGKTSLLRAIAGLHPPHSGRVLLAGRTASDGPAVKIPPAQRRVGMLFQNGALWPHMTVHGTLSFVMKQARVSASQRQGKQRQARGGGSSRVAGRRARAAAPSQGRSRASARAAR